MRQPGVACRARRPGYAKTGADEGTRTPTGLLPQPPQSCVSASFTTSARYLTYNVVKNVPDLINLIKFYLQR